MRRYNVEAVCTTDDPVDSLEHHIKVREDGFATRMLPTWRPDKAMAVEVSADFRAYMEKLSEVSGVAITKFADVIDALRVRHEFFGSVGLPPFGPRHRGVLCRGLYAGRDRRYF